MNVATFKACGSWLATVSMAVATALAGTAAQADIVIGLNFHSGTQYALAATDVAGLTPAANWNNGGADNNLSGLTLNRSTGTASTVTAKWSSNGIYETWTPGGSASAGDAKLMKNGLRSIRAGSSGWNPPTAAQIFLENLNATFPGTYNVTLFVGEWDNNFTYGASTIYTNTDASATSAWVGNNGGYTASTSPPAGSTSQGLLSPSNGSGFNGTWTSGVNYRTITGLTADKLLLTGLVTGGAGAWQVNNFTGMQITGVPEPASVALSGTAVALAAGGMLLRRRPRGRLVA